MRQLSALFLTAVLLFVAACSGKLMSVSPSASSSAMTLMIKDTPPSGVTILRFEITVTGASLQPTDSGAAAVSLLTAPAKVELERLQTETAFLSTAPAPPGTYASIMVTFANPEMTILNNSGAAITLGNTTCAVNAVCKLEPPLNPASVTTSTSPFPLTLGANSPMGLLLDFDVNASVQNNLSVNPSISFAQANARENELEDMDDLLGAVASVGSNQFIITDSATGMSFTINVDANTEFKFEESCQANNFSCVMTGQVLKVDATVTATGSLVAREVELEEDQNEEEIEGVVVSVDAANNKFQFVALGHHSHSASVGLGSPITVQVQAGARFQVDSDGLNVPGSLSFASIQDVIAGQEIQIRPSGASSTSSGVAIVNTDRVRLRTAQIAGAVGSISAPNFTLINLPAQFTMSGVTQLQVITSSQTGFDGLGNIQNLSSGEAVAVRGLLFSSSGSPALIAKKVRAHTSH